MKPLRTWMWAKDCPAPFYGAFLSRGAAENSTVRPTRGTGYRVVRVEIREVPKKARRKP
jgi:hypothetical protein